MLRENCFTEKEAVGEAVLSEVAGEEARSEAVGEAARSEAVGEVLSEVAAVLSEAVEEAVRSEAVIEDMEAVIEDMEAVIEDTADFVETAISGWEEVEEAPDGGLDIGGGRGDGRFPVFQTRNAYPVSATLGTVLSKRTHTSILLKETQPVGRHGFL